MQNALDKGKSARAIFMDLFKAFDTVNHDLLVAKLEAYGFYESSLNYIQSWLDNRLQIMRMITSAYGKTFLLVFRKGLFLFADNACLSNYTDDCFKPR